MVGAGGGLIEFMFPLIKILDNISLIYLQKIQYISFD